MTRIRLVQKYSNYTSIIPAEEAQCLNNNLLKCQCFASFEPENAAAIRGRDLPN